MTEHWRKKLENIDGASPSDDVFARAKEGPMHSDDPLPGPRMSTRIVTIVAAVLVFALAISVFAIPALRIGNQAAGQGSVLLPLWPAQTSDQLEQLQANPPSWALDPKLVAQHFTQEVMGWSTPSAPDAACDLPAYASTSPSYSSSTPDYSGFSDGCGSIRFDPSSASPGYAYPTNSAGPSQDGAFRTYQVAACVGCVSHREFVQVYQPLEQGDGQIWAVLQAQGEETLSVAPGQVVHDGSSVSAGFVSGRFELVPTLGYGSCGQSAASSAASSPGGTGGAGIQVDVHLTGGCEGEQPGYVWAATSNVSLADTGDGIVDPFAGGRPGLASITAAPVTMIFPSSTGETTAPTSPTPDKSSSPAVAPVSWTTYTDPYGWTIDVPTGWETNVITAKGGGTQGARFIGDNISIQVSTQTPPEGSPPPALTVPAANDSTFPLTTDGVLAPVEGGLGGHFVGDGLQFDVLVLSPSLPDPLPQVDADVLDRMIGSILFQPWNVGDVRHDWVAIPTPTEDVSWIKVEGGLYMLFKASDGYKIYGSISCGGKEPSKTTSSADGYAVLDCPDGSTWEMNATGASGGGGDAAGNDPPPEWAVATAQDGTLIAWILPGVFPEGTGGS